jgi:hypothetical protein
MTNRIVFLSGYPTNALTGRIDIDTSLMRDAAERCTRERRLSWADVRMLDDGFRRDLSAGLEPNLTYLRHKHVRKHAGLHLCAILSGLRFHLSPQEHIASPRANGVKFHVQSSTSPRLFVCDDTAVRMNFPNPLSGLAGGENASADYGLYNLQLNSAFGRYCRGFDGHMAANDVAANAANYTANVGRVINNYVKKIYADKTLCESDKNDVIAICMLKAWVGGKSGTNPLNTVDNLGYWYDFSGAAPDQMLEKTVKTSAWNKAKTKWETVDTKTVTWVPHPSKLQIQKLLKSPCDYRALRYACESLSGFGENFCVSWTDYTNAYPDVR